MLEVPDPETIDLVIMHFAEKGPDSDFGHCPYPNYTYRLVKIGFEGKELWVIPELEGNFNLTKRCEWLAENFAGIPVVIDVFEGGLVNWPNPNVLMNTTQLQQIMTVANVTAIRFPEVISWYMDLNKTQRTDIPTPWIHEMFEFALNNKLEIYWSGWKLGTDVEKLTNETLAGYEDKITYLYQTNNEYQHPLIGYSTASKFPHWGASVQSWWKDEGIDRDDLPLETVAEYAALARRMGAEIIQFEPYWYFIEESQPLEPTYKMWSIV